MDYETKFIKEIFGLWFSLILLDCIVSWDGPMLIQVAIYSYIIGFTLRLYCSAAVH